MLWGNVQHSQTVQPSTSTHLGWSTRKATLTMDNRDDYKRSQTINVLCNLPPNTEPMIFYSIIVYNFWKKCTCKHHFPQLRSVKSSACICQVKTETKQWITPWSALPGRQRCQPRLPLRGRGTTAAFTMIFSTAHIPLCKRTQIPPQHTHGWITRKWS